MKHIISDDFEAWFDDDGRYHRDNGPAVIVARSNGVDSIWYQHGERHRDNGPSVISCDGDLCYQKQGKLHRLDGPAIIHTYINYQEWWVDGEQIHCKDNEEFLRIVKLKELL
jgi:hypothetical protein